MDRNIGSGTDFIERIKAIPVLDICRQLGIETERKGNRFWCKMRDERTASCLLNTDTVPNTYCDFGGSNKRGDVIQFVSEVRGTDRSDATKYLADAFNISHDKQQRRGNELADWEYEKIGLYGDMATKNFTFDFERQSLERISELSNKYAMPMNELRKKHPKIYEQLLRDKAIPHVRNMRNNYYMNLVSFYNIANTDDFSRFPDAHASLTAEIQALCNAERLLVLAAEKTSLKVFPVGTYEPSGDLKKILAGEIKPAIGNHTYSEMKAAAKAANCDVKYRTVPWDKFPYEKLDKFPHSAFFKGDQIVVGYLEIHHKEIRPFFDKAAGRGGLEDKIADAEDRRRSQPAPGTPPNLHNIPQR